MVFHLHLVELIKSKFGDALDQNGKLAPEKGCLGLEVDLLFNWSG